MFALCASAAAASRPARALPPARQLTAGVAPPTPSLPALSLAQKLLHDPSGLRSLDLSCNLIASLGAALTNTRLSRWKDDGDRRDRVYEACSRLVEREWRRARVFRVCFNAWREMLRLRLSGPERRAQRLEAEVAYWRRSVDGARQVIDEQQRKLGEQALKIASLQKDHAVLTAEGHKAHAFVSTVEEQSRAVAALQVQVATMARLELSSGEEHSRSLSHAAVRLAEQARGLLLTMRDRERRLEEDLAAHAETEAALRAALAGKAALEGKLAAMLHHPPARRNGERPDGGGGGSAAAEPQSSAPAQLHQRSQSVGTLGAQLARLSDAERERGRLAGVRGAHSRSPSEASSPLSPPALRAGWRASSHDERAFTPRAVTAASRVLTD